MADKYYTFEEAVNFMRWGYVMAPSLASYDYYIIKKVKTYDKHKTALVMFGLASCDSELFLIQEDELAIIKSTTWYIISKPEEKQNEN